MHFSLSSFASASIATIIFSTAQANPILRRQSGAGTTWDPPLSLVLPLNETWAHEMSTYDDPLGFKNWGYDQVMATNGSINYCVRWESNSSITAAERANVEVALQRSFKKWIDWLVGFESFPYTEVPVKIVGWAVSNTTKLLGDTSDIDVYTTTDADGIPQCSEDCGRFFHTDGDYSKCSGGLDRHYDESLWLTDGWDGGAGGDWGQRVGQEYFMEAINNENIHILLHEIGHTFALDDFYDWIPTNMTNFIMLAGSSTVITDFDGWMLRDWWRHLKSRYGL
ncbi:hypothetical protein RUND412_004075 [Rhizina undulata]